MSFQYVETWIEGTMLLLMAAFGLEAAENVPGGSGPGTRPSITAVKQLTPREHAEKSCYRESHKADAPLVFPGTGVQRAMVEAGGNHKEKGTRKSMKYRVPAAVLVLDELAPLYAEDRKTRITTYEVDSRRVVNPTTKGALLAHRPRIERWTLKCVIRINENLMDPAFVRQLLTEAGEQLGIGAFRPEKRGPFGLFHVVAWDCVDGTAALKKRKVA
jgi:hypothetical protein